MELNLKPGHIIHTMTEEHKMILGFLDELEKTNQRIQEEGKYSGDNGDFEKLENIAEHLVGAEPHYQREEEVLFPEIENDILYPLSLEVIPEEVVWQEMKKECDEIGYCCFTPKV